jgi:hypothetical protein
MCKDFIDGSIGIENFDGIKKPRVIFLTRILL